MNLGDFYWSAKLPPELSKWVNGNVESAIKAFTKNLGLMATGDVGKIRVMNDLDYLFEPPLELRDAFDLGPRSLDPRDPHHLQWAEYLEELAGDIRLAITTATVDQANQTDRPASSRR